MTTADEDGGNTKYGNILLVEDDTRLAELTSAYLQQNGFTVVIEHRGDRVIERFQQLSLAAITSDGAGAAVPQLVILDLMLPGLDGMEVCKRLRKIYSGPILMLTAKFADIDQVIGLESGADDYVVKPAEPMVLLARVRALLRRKGGVIADTDKPIVLGDLHINEQRQEVMLDNRPVDLTTQEFDLLCILAREPGKVFSREDLFKLTRGIDYNGTDRSIDVRISRLRRKLGDDPQNPARLKTVWGKGYLLMPDSWQTS